MTEKTLTVKQAIAITPEDFATLSLEELQTVANVLASSKDKKAVRKLDLVKGTLEKRRKEAKKAGDKEAEKEVKAVENSVKRGSKNKDEKKDKPKVKVKTGKNARKNDKEQKEKVKEQLKEAEEDNAPEADEVEDVKALKKRLAEIEKENAKLKAEVFPDVLEREDLPSLVALHLPTVEEVQKILKSRPYELFMYAHEGLDNKPTAFTVLYMNDEILVLLDRSREVNTTLTVKTSKMKNGKTVRIDSRDCPYRYYIAETK